MVLAYESMTCPVSLTEGNSSTQPCPDSDILLGSIHVYPINQYLSMFNSVAGVTTSYKTSSILR